MHNKKLYGTATVGTKGQVVIPADAREELGIQAGDRLYVVGVTEKGWVGFIKEDQLRQIVEHVTEGLENYKNLLNNPAADEEKFED
ncbi:TPA: AbrB family transcriptional regulator [Candidatus Saccharibacteria bacterium]|nr:AbrB family transcriptional regulator [Candidatus Saccharibacteria bacterium]HRJ90905.1 AbrB/MazE/SpoVT family DNA-binding domain-containing protein [Candidatus Saccharibacteria bacterium]